jgi:capsular exopolysaccharide synthesis family protein
VNLSDYLRVVRQHWMVITATFLVALVAAWVTESIQGDRAAPIPTYEGTVVLAGAAPNPNFGGAIPPNPEAVAGFVSLYDVARRAATDLGYQGDPLDLTSQVTASVDPNTTLVTIVARAPGAGQAKELADAFAGALLDFLVDYRVKAAQPVIDQLEAQIASLKQNDPTSPLIDQYSTTLGVLRLAQYDPGYSRIEAGPARPVPQAGFQAPRSFLAIAVVAGVIGLVLGFGIALILARYDTRIRSKRAAEEDFGLPVLAEIPVIPYGQREALVYVTDPGSAPAEAFRILATEVARWPVLNGNGDVTLKADSGALLVTSAGPSEGKTTVTANLAVAFAEMGKRVIILSCDFRRPDVHRFFGVPNEEGLTDELKSSNGKDVLSGRTWDTAYDRVSVVPSGPPLDTPGELLSSDTMAKALAEAKAAADIVIIDTAPALIVSDAARLLPHANAVLLVARAGKTRSDVAVRTSELLRRLAAPMLGVVLNGSKEITAPRDYRKYVRSNRDDPAVRVRSNRDDPAVRENPTYPVTQDEDSV